MKPFSTITKVLLLILCLINITWEKKLATNGNFLTIFTTMNPSEEVALQIRQKNALRSWIHLKSPSVSSVIIFGSEPSIQSMVREVSSGSLSYENSIISELEEHSVVVVEEEEWDIDISLASEDEKYVRNATRFTQRRAPLIFVEEVERSTRFPSRPLINKMFEKANEISNTSMLLFTNADLIFFDDLIVTLRKLQSRFYGEDFLIIGQRFDYRVDSPLNFHEESSELQQHFWKEYEQSSNRLRSIHNDLRWAIDFFCFTKEFWKKLNVEIKPFIVGATTFDNWLVHQVVVSGKIIVDVSRTVLALHQQHPFSHRNDMNQYNMDLAQRWYFGNLDRANYYTEFCIKKRRTTLETAENRSSLFPKKTICVRKREMNSFLQ